MGKSDTPETIGSNPFYSLGGQTSIARLATTNGLSGVNARDYAESLTRDILGQFFRAPLPFELWFAAGLSGRGGSSGTASGTAVSGGNGGNGWRGSGGGGGAGAGVSGASGGSGGVGGNGVVYFFWEEY